LNSAHAQPRAKENLVFFNRFSPRKLKMTEANLEHVAVLCVEFSNAVDRHFETAYADCAKEELDALGSDHPDHPYLKNDSAKEAAIADSIARLARTREGKDRVTGLVPAELVQEENVALLRSMGAYNLAELCQQLIRVNELSRTFNSAVKEHFGDKPGEDGYRYVSEAISQFNTYFDHPLFAIQHANSTARVAVFNEGEKIVAKLIPDELKSEENIAILDSKGARDLARLCLYPTPR
jgi:hypothetical protein